jgi:hypothetical protein
MTNTIDIRVDGDSIDIEVETLSPIEQMLWAGKAPDEITDIDDTSGGVSVGEETVKFLIELTTSQTILTRELLEELSQDELSRLFNGVVMLSFDSDHTLPERGGDQYRLDTDDTVEWSDDGSVDLDEWR